MNAHALPEPEPGFETLTSEIERYEAIIGHWEASQQSVALAYRNAIDALSKQALRKMISELKNAPLALEALRKSAADPLVYGVLRYHGLLQPSLQERVEKALASVRPMLAAHGGDVELVTVIPPDTVEVRFRGNCDGCSASALTFVAGVKRAIEEHCPEITHIRQVKGQSGASAAHFTSPFVEEGWSFATELQAIPEAGVTAVSIDGTALLLARNGEGITCFRDACAHLGLPLSTGKVSNGVISCPWHGFEYDLATGECLTASEVQLQPVPLRIVEGRVEVRLGA